MNALILSAALDTNGQNARFARASERWGTDEGVVKALAVGRYDPASVVGRFQAAAAKTAELRIRSAHMATHLYQQMPADIVWDRTTMTQVYRLAEDADVIHLNNSTRAMAKIRMPIGRKPLVLHHHGSLLRDNPYPQLDSGRLWRAVQVVSTVDLLLFSEDLAWLPTAYDVDWLSAFGRERGRAPDGRLRIVTCPTNRGIKSTDALEAAVAEVRQDIDVELVIVENRSWADAMAIKATADIYFDQVKLGYGCNAIEAWGMGIPVIAGAGPKILDRMRSEWKTKTLPFYTATEDTIADAIRALADPKTRTTYAQRGMRHVRKYHDELPALIRLAGFYHRAMYEPAEERGRFALPRQLPVTFRSTEPQIIIGNRRCTFVNEEFTTDNPHLIRRLRKMALAHPRYRLEEVA
jgi:hypothetical protein